MNVIVLSRRQLLITFFYFLSLSASGGPGGQKAQKAQKGPGGQKGHFGPPGPSALKTWILAQKGPKMAPRARKKGRKSGGQNHPQKAESWKLRFILGLRRKQRILRSVNGPENPFISRPRGPFSRPRAAKREGLHGIREIRRRGPFWALFETNSESSFSGLPLSLSLSLSLSLRKKM